MDHHRRGYGFCLPLYRKEAKTQTVYVIEVQTERGWVLQSITERRDRAIRLWEDAMMEGYKSVRVTYSERKSL